MKGRQGMRLYSKSFCTNYFWKLQVDLNAIYSAVNALWSDELHTDFITIDQYAKERSLHWWCGRHYFGMHLGMYWSISFKLDDGRHWTLHIKTRLNDLNLHARSLKLRKQELCSFSVKFSIWFGWNLVFCHALLLCWSTHWMWFLCDEYSRDEIVIRWFSLIHMSNIWIHVISCVHDFIRYTINIGLRSDALEAISYSVNPGMTINTTKLSSVIPVWRRKLEFVQSF